jgi:hypothetical protein
MHACLLKKFQFQTHFFAFASEHENLENIAIFSTIFSIQVQIWYILVLFKPYHIIYNMNRRPELLLNNNEIISLLGPDIYPGGISWI